MKDSDVLKMMARANFRLGYLDYAKQLEDRAVVYEANEVIQEAERGER